MSDSNPQSEPFDAKRWLAALQQSTVEHQRVVEQRPKANDLGESLRRFTAPLSDWTDTWRSMAAVRREVDPSQDYALYPLVSAPAQADLVHWEPHVARYCEDSAPSSGHWFETNPIRNPVAWGLDFLARCFNTVFDDFAGIAVLIQTERHVRAPITLARSVLEAAGIACHIIDPMASQTERLRRVLNLHFDELKEACNARGGDDGQSDSSVELAELIAFADQLGFNVKYKPERWMAPVILADGRVQPDSVRKVVEEVLPGVGVDMWRSLSAVAHSRESRTVLPDEYAPGHMIKSWQRTESVAWHTLAPMMMVRELCIRIERYLGWEFSEPRKLLDAIVLQWSIGGGLYDKQIRSNLGLV